MTKGERIKAARKKAGMTQAQLAEKLGISFQSVAQWENDLRNPKQETLQKIADALGVSIFDLLGLEDVGKQLAKVQEQLKKAAEPAIKAQNQLQQQMSTALQPLYSILHTMDIPDNPGTVDDVARKELLEHFDALNTEGKIIAAERVGELAKVPDYQKPKTSK